MLELVELLFFLCFLKCTQLACSSQSMKLKVLLFPTCVHAADRAIMFPSSARSAPRKSLSLSVKPGGACAVNPATPNLQGLGVCVYMCVFVCEKKKRCAMCTA